MGFCKHQSEGSCCCCLTCKLGPTLCDPMDRSTPGLPVCHQLPEPTQTHIHGVGNAIQPSHPLSPLSSCPRSFRRWTPVLQTGVMRAASAPWGMKEQASPLRDHREPGNLLNYQVGKYIVPLEMEISHRKMQWVFSLVLCRMNKYNCRINVFIIQNIASQNLLTLKNS